MLEIISKLLSTIVSAKTSSKIICFCLLLTLFGSKVKNLIIKSDIPSEHSFILSLLLIFSLSVLLVECAMYFFTTFKELYHKKKMKKEKQQVAQKEKAKIESTFKFTLPHFSEQQVKILKELLIDTKVYKWRADNIRMFNESKYIEFVGKKNSEYFVYRLNPIIKNDLSNFINQQLKQQASEILKSLSEAEKDFLRIFFEEKIPFGTLESDNMTAKTYHAKRQFINKGLITSQENRAQWEEIYTITGELKNQLLEQGHFKKCYRVNALLKGEKILRLGV